MCPAGGEHLAAEPGYSPHMWPVPPDNLSPDFDFDEFHEDTLHEPNWRFCGKRQGLFFWEGDTEARAMQERWIA